MSLLDKAIKMAIDAHDGQLDKGGKPCILHPLRVMLRMESTDEMIVAILHDTLEDTDLDPKEITKHFGIGILLEVDRLSRKRGEKYFEYIRRVKTSKLATKVKLADLFDNMDPQRVMALPEDERDIVNRYQKAVGILSS